MSECNYQLSTAAIATGENMKNFKPAHTPQLLFPVKGDCLHIGGIPLTQLAQQIGSTPFYAYDKNQISQRVQHIRTYFPPEVLLHYSVKANPMPALLQYMQGLVDGFDIASAGELSLVLDTQMSPDQISFAGPGKTDAELEQSLTAGVIIHLESENEMIRLARIGKSLGIIPQVMVRVNPDFELKSSGMKMGGGASKFGIDSELVPKVLKQLGSLGMNLLGLHIYAGSQNLSSSSIIEAQNKTFEMAIDLAQQSTQKIQILNIGGGFGIPYFAGETPLDIKPIGENLHQWLLRINSKLPDVKVVVELGRYLVGEAGIYVSKVIDRKQSRGQTFLICDGGMNHHLAASGNLGQTIRKNYHVVVGNKFSGAPREIVTVTGPLCTPLDLIADKMEMACAKPGDLIVIFQSGAYGLSASPTGFLSHSLPKEVLV